MLTGRRLDVGDAGLEVDLDDVRIRVGIGRLGEPRRTLPGGWRRSRTRICSMRGQGKRHEGGSSEAAAGNMPMCHAGLSMH